MEYRDKWRRSEYKIKRFLPLCVCFGREAAFIRKRDSSEWAVSFCGPLQGGDCARPCGRGGMDTSDGWCIAPPIFSFSSRRKRENGPCTVQKRKRSMRPAGDGRRGDAQEVLPPDTHVSCPRRSAGGSFGSCRMDFLLFSLPLTWRREEASKRWRPAERSRSSGTH